MKHFLVNKHWYLILLLCILLLNIGINLIIKSPITNYYFSKLCIPSFIMEVDRNFLIINIGCIFFLTLIIFIKKIKIKLWTMNLIKILTIIIIILGLILNCLIGYKSIIKVDCKISGNSMYPTLESQDNVKVSFSKKIKKNKIVVFEVNNKYFDVGYSGSQYYIKRIIGLPGEQLKYINNKLYINDSLIIEEYLTSESFSNKCGDFLGTFTYKKDGNIMNTTTIPDGFCFVMGDNRKVDQMGNNQSYDSRELGLVPFDSIIGIIV